MAITWRLLLPVALLVIAAAPARADCHCSCVGGDLRTVCTTLEEAQNDPTMCGYHAATCPQPAADSFTETGYESPVEGAVNCRDIPIWDGLRGAYIAVKACDVGS